MNLEEHKQRMLKHCLWMSEMDEDYAVWAADRYESDNPIVLKNLGAKVRQEISRKQRQAEVAE